MALLEPCWLGVPVPVEVAAAEAEFERLAPEAKTLGDDDPVCEGVAVGVGAALDVTVELIVFVSEGLCDGDAVFDREIDLLCVVVGAAVDVPDEDSLIVGLVLPVVEAVHPIERDCVWDGVSGGVTDGVRVMVRDRVCERDAEAPWEGVSVSDADELAEVDELPVGDALP